MLAQVGELRAQLKGTEEESKQVVANKVRAEALLQEKAAECDWAFSIRNRRQMSSITGTGDRPW